MKKDEFEKKIKKAKVLLIVGGTFLICNFFTKDVAYIHLISVSVITYGLLKYADINEEMERLLNKEDSEESFYQKVV